MSPARVLDPDFYLGDPFPAFRRLRDEEPVSRQEYPTPAWVVTRHEDVLAVLRDHETFCSSRGITVLDTPREYKQPLIEMDPPRHTRLRRILGSVFTPRRIDALAPEIRGLAGRLVEPMRDSEVVDLVDAFAAPLPIGVIGRMLGVPDEDLPLLRTWTDVVIGSTNEPIKPETIGALAELYGYFGGLVAERSSDPGEDLVSLLSTAEVEGDRLAEEELLGTLMLLVVAGNETTRTAISGGALALLRHPETATRLTEHPELLPTATEEILRWVSPVIHMRRTATRAATIRGVRIAAGDKVVALFPSANRDERVFDAPESFDITRTPNPHLAFGHGIHHCLGASLGRLELRLALERLCPLLRDASGAGPVERISSNFVRGIHRLPVHLSPTSRAATADDRVVG